MRPRTTPDQPRSLDLRDAARALAPTLDAAPALRRRAIATWRGRMINEHHSARVFAGLAGQFEGIGAPAAQVDAVAAMADEEHHHGVLCGAVVEALGGEAVGALPPDDALPMHPEVDRLEALTRNLLSVGCLSETVAVSLIAAEREQMPEGPLREIITRILADEIGHARLGWRFVARHVPRMDAAARARLGRYLAVAFAHLEAHELSHLPIGAPLPAGAEALGLCQGREARALFYDTVDQVIVPRLEGYGISAAAAWRDRARPHAQRGRGAHGPVRA